jgi:ribose/xylose/arabinose/galactoside ABC-type transport system permease subunit
MALDDRPQPSGLGSRYLGEGFRNEPDFREGTTATVDAVATPTSLTEGEQTVTIAGRGPNLSYVFDDPAEGEPGRDRMLVHGLWELLLALGLAAGGYLLYHEQPDAFSGNGLRQLLLGVTVLGLLGAASAVALRAAAPNLAVGAVAVAAALFFGHNSDGGLSVALLTVIGLCAVIGLVQGLVTVGLQVPGWAASAGVALVLLAWSERRGQVSLVDVYDPAVHTFIWLGGFIGVSVLAGIAGLIPAVRRAVGRFRPVADPARRRGLVAALITLAAIIVSSVLAGLAGVLAVAGTSGANTGEPVLTAFALTALALGAALLGGTSAFGRRGGIFGTVLAAGLVAVAAEYSEATERTWSPFLVAAVAIGLGLAVTRLVERYGRPAPGSDENDDEDWVPKAHTSTASGWPATSKASTATTSLGLWASDDAWGTGDGR